MAFSTCNKHWFFVSTLTYWFLSASKFGNAFEYPHLGAAGVIADEYLPQAQIEGETAQYFPQAGIIGTTPALVFNRALECLNDKYIYSSCDADHRLTQSGELNIPPEYTDAYCNGPCLAETHHVLDCINDIFKYFIFYNRGSLGDVRDALEGGCSHGPLRGNFNVASRIQTDSSNEVLNPVSHVIILMVVAWKLFF